MTSSVDRHPASTATAPENSADFTPLRVDRVIRETADAVSLVLSVPASVAPRFGYRAGQFLTLQVHIDGQEYRRCYSMSSSPVLGDDLRITVKRDGVGVVSNWLNDASVGDELHAAPPAGRFVLREQPRNLIAFAGGSGITPVYSLITSALAGDSRAAKLFYANRSRLSVIFEDALANLTAQHPERLLVHHHLDEDRGVVSPDDIRSFVAAGDADYYVCGPGPFMDTVEQTLLAEGVPRDRLHLERFTTTIPAEAAPADAAADATEEITFELGKQVTTVPYRAGNTLLQTARLAGLRAPSSCETGSCGTCMAQVTEGSARMLNNDALEDDEVAEGWVLTCQSLPTGRTVRVVYE